ncbi:MAG: LptF/LptG family permease [Planctomycetota bacterium]|nr:LptF/LptG family permease [Planctomycetota bacterium]
MRTLDRYIAWHYIVNIAMLFTFLFSVIIVIDFSLNFDEFIEIAGRIARERGWEKSRVREALLAFALVLDLWWPRLFQLFHYLAGVVIVGGMGFTCAQMVRHREFVAILAGGISLQRAARPLVLVALGVVTLQAINAEVILPRLAPMLTRDKKEAGTRGLGETRQPLTADGAGRLFYARRVDLDAGVVEGLWVWERDGRGLMTRRITAQKATWAGDHWQLDAGVVETPGDLGASGRRVTTPLSRLDTDLDPTAMRLRRFEGYSHNLSSAHLTELVDRLKAQPRPPTQRIETLERIRSGRYAIMLANVLTLLVCLPFFLRREPTGLLRQSIKCAPVAFGAILGTGVGVTAAVPGLPAWLGVFVPVLILVPLATAAMSSVKT